MEVHPEDRAGGRLALWPDMDLLSSERLLWLWQSEAPQELVEAVRHAIATQLSDRQREVIEGYFFEGLSQPELALKLGISQQVIHKCLYGQKRKGRMVGGALKRLRASLTPLVGA